MSLLLNGRKSWTVLSQLKQSVVPSLFRHRSVVPLALGLQNVRALPSPCTFHGSLLSPCTTASFSSAVEAASMAGPSVPSEDMDTRRDDESEYTTAQPMASKSEQEEVVLTKLVEDHRQLFTVLQSELEFQKISINSILEEIRVLKAKDASGVEASTVVKQAWPLWTVFIEYLQSSGFFKGEVKTSDADTVLDDPACVKRAIIKFSQVEDAIYESLSQMDLRLLANYGSVASDPKAAASQMRLRQFFQAEYKVLDSATSKSTSPRPKLEDVTRLIFSTISASQEDALSSDVKLSISHLLREIISLSSKPKTPVASSREAITPSRAAPIRASDLFESFEQEEEEPSRIEKKQGLLKVKTKKLDDTGKSAGKAEVREESSAKLQQWKCPRCSFVNLDSKHICVECSRRRPQSTYAAGTVKNTEEECSGDELLKALDDEKPKKAHESWKKDSPSTTQVRKGLKDRSLVEEDEDTDMERDVNGKESKVGGDSDNDLDILDDILESEDSSEEPRGKGRRDGVSDLSDEEPKDDSKKTRLSELMPSKKLRAPPKRGGDFGRRGGRPPPLKGLKRFDEEDGGSDEEDGRIEGRGGRLGRGRGGFHNDRRNGGGGRGYGDRDRGYGDRDRGYGDRDRGSGDRDRNFGDRYRGFGDRDRGYGDRDQGGRGSRGRSRY